MIAVLLVAALTAATVASFYAYASKFRGDGGQLEALGLVTSRDGCRTDVLLASATRPVDLSQLTIQPLSGTDGDYTITLAGRSTHDAPWVGAAGDGTLVAGATFQVWSSAPSRAFLVIDRAAGAAVGRFQAPQSGFDAGASARVDPTNATPTTLTGTVWDACSGAGAVRVQVLDATAGLAWNGVAFSSTSAPAQLAGVVTTPGATTSAWTLDVSGIPWTPDHSFTIQATAVAVAGDSGASQAGTIETTIESPQGTACDGARDEEGRGSGEAEDADHAENDSAATHHGENETDTHHGQDVTDASHPEDETAHAESADGASDAHSARAACAPTTQSEGSGHDDEDHETDTQCTEDETDTPDNANDTQRAHPDGEHASSACHELDAGHDTPDPPVTRDDSPDGPRHHMDAP